MSRLDPGRGVYGISVAAELVGMGAQTLRLYETRGLLEPERTSGGTRRYSPDDLDRVRRIGQLLTGGLNLAGIAMVLDLEEQNTYLRTIHQEHPMSTDPGPKSVDPDLLEHLIPEADRLEQATPADPADQDQAP
ncbi:MAG: MerR family transcriptional regulator [Terracoccus sp.]